MTLSNDLISQFVKVTKDEVENKSESTVYGTTVLYNDKMYVRIDGSDLLTPIETTTEVESGERVTIMIKDHSATVTGNITSPSVGPKTIGKIGDQISVFEIIIADKVSTKEFDAENARIEKLIATKATIEDLEAINAVIENLDVEMLTAVYAEIETLKATKADIDELTATSAEIDILNATMAKIETLINGNLTSKNIQSLNITSDKFTVEDGFIKDAMIENVSAAKINSGTINTNFVNIQSDDGGLQINGNTQQFKDKNGVVRIQIGKDASGNFTFVLFDQNGTGVLIDSEGIKAGAVPDGLIVNDMVADNAAISGGKLDINSVIQTINDKGTTTLKSSKIKLDETNQTLEVAFKTLKNQVDAIEEVTISGDLSSVITQVTSNTTDLQIMQGKIEELISATTITKQDGSVISLKDEYNNVKNTVDSHTRTIGQYESKFDDVTGDIESITSRQTQTQNDLDGFKNTVSSTYTTKTSFSNYKNEVTETVKGVNTNISSLEKYIDENYSTTTETNTAISESVDGITRTMEQIKTDIKDNYSKKTEVSTQITESADGITRTFNEKLGNYYTRTEVQETVDKVKFSYSASGGHNLLRNSAFATNYDYWHPLRWDSTAGGHQQTYIRYVDNIDDYWTLPNRNTLCSVVNQLTSDKHNIRLAAGFDSETFEVRGGKTYTISCYLATHRVASASIEMLCYDNNGTRLEGNNAWTGKCNLGGRKRQDWTRVCYTFTAQTNAVRCHMRVFMNHYIHQSGQDSGVLWLGEPIVVEGSYEDLIWSPHSDELYTGITSIDKDGIKVSMSDGEGQQGYTRLGYDGMEIYNSKGKRIAWFGDSDTAYIGTLTADTIYNRYILKWNSGRPTHLYLSPDGSGDRTGRNADNKANSIETTLNWLWNTYGCYSYKQDIILNFDGGDYWSSSNYIGGWIGTGKIVLRMNPWTCLRSQLKIEECTMSVEVTGTVDTSKRDVQNNAFIWVDNADAVVVRNSNVLLKNINIRRSGWSGAQGVSWTAYYYSGVWLDLGAHVTMQFCDVVGFSDMFYALEGTTVGVIDCRGHCWRYGPVGGGAMLRCVGSMPLASQATQFWGGVVVADGNQYGMNSWYDPKPDQPYTPPPAPTENWQWVSQTFNAYALSTYPEGSGVTTSGKRDCWGQGSWSSYKSHRGYASFSAINSWCHGGRNFSATLTMTRLNTSHGYAGATPHPMIKNTDGSFWDSGVYYARGDTKSINLPGTITTALVTGGWDTLEMWAGASHDQYSFYNNVYITITCEKNMI